MLSIDTFFARLQLPSISEVAQQLIKTLNDDDAGAFEVSTIMAQDPALTAKLLRLANSAQFGLPRSVSNLQEAIQLVGMGKVRSMALGSCLSQSFPVLPGLDSQEFWRSSMACAGYAQWLAGATGADPQQAWLAGMMLRLGEVLIGQVNPTVVIEIERLPLQAGGRWSREKRLVGFSEGQVTAELARRWTFPVAIVKALEHSLDPVAEAVFYKLAGVVHLAGTLADVPQAQAELIDSLPSELLSKLALEPQWLKDHFPAAEAFVHVN